MHCLQSQSIPRVQRGRTAGRLAEFGHIPRTLSSRACFFPDHPPGQGTGFAPRPQKRKVAPRPSTLRRARPPLPLSRKRPCYTSIKSPASPRSKVPLAPEAKVTVAPIRKSSEPPDESPEPPSGRSPFGRSPSAEPSAEPSAVLLAADSIRGKMLGGRVHGELPNGWFSIGILLSLIHI